MAVAVATAVSGAPTTAVVTLRLRVKQRHYAFLNKAAVEVNRTWNYCNEMSQKAIQRFAGAAVWLSGFDLCNLTAGCTGAEGGFCFITADTVQKVCTEYPIKRLAAAKAGRLRNARLRWRASWGSKRALGWIPAKAASFTWFLRERVDADGNPLKPLGGVKYAGHKITVFQPERLPVPPTRDQVRTMEMLRGQPFTPAEKRRLARPWKDGCFAQDSCGDWWLCLPVEVPCVPMSISTTQALAGMLAGDAEAKIEAGDEAGLDGEPQPPEIQAQPVARAAEAEATVTGSLTQADACTCGVAVEEEVDAAGDGYKPGACETPPGGEAGAERNGVHGKSKTSVKANSMAGVRAKAANQAKAGPSAAVHAESLLRQAKAAGLRVVGLDPGCKEAAVCSDGKRIHSGHYRQREKRIAEAQRRGHLKRAKREHRKAARCRKDSYHKVTRRLIDKHDIIAIGNASPSRLARSLRLGKSVNDAAWGELKAQLLYKGQHAGKHVLIVDEKFTTQGCSGCGALTGPKGRTDLVARQWRCRDCEAWHDRDINAAKNIAAAALRLLGCHPAIAPVAAPASVCGKRAA